MGRTKAHKTALRGTSSLEGAPRLFMIGAMLSSWRGHWLSCSDSSVP
jgi:hypothetical protein